MEMKATHKLTEKGSGRSWWFSVNNEVVHYKMRDLKDRKWSKSFYNLSHYANHQGFTLEKLQVFKGNK